MGLNMIPKFVLMIILFCEGGLSNSLLLYLLLQIMLSQILRAKSLIYFNINESRFAWPWHFYEFQFKIKNIITRLTPNIDFVHTWCHPALKKCQTKAIFI